MLRSECSSISYNTPLCQQSSSAGQNGAHEGVDFADAPEEVGAELAQGGRGGRRRRFCLRRFVLGLSSLVALTLQLPACTPETALRLIAEALGEVPGSKTLVFFGHGMGQLSGPGVSFHGDYDLARRALLEASVTVFTLDVTDADHHTLEVGLQQVAAETGGFYARAHNFSGQAVSRLEEALAGHYVLEVVHPSGPSGRHELEVDLVNRSGRVLARKTYFD